LDLITAFITYMTKLLQSDWLRGVQLMIFVMARGGWSGKSKQQKSNMAAKFVLQTWTNLTTFWHQNEFKKHCMAKRSCGKYLEVVLRNNLGGMQRNVTM
jgi:hypothetical protein